MSMKIFLEWSVNQQIQNMLKCRFFLFSFFITWPKNSITMPQAEISHKPSFNKQKTCEQVQLHAVVKFRTF